MYSLIARDSYKDSLFADNEERNPSKADLELDLSNCQQCTLVPASCLRMYPSDVPFLASYA